MTDFSRLKRKKQPMPAYVREALLANGLMNDYKQRPAYQQNDYLSWITRARRPSTREKRLKQMLAELEQGGIYMKMDHPPSGKES